MAENLIHRLVSHQGCVMHFHRGELIFNWECNVRALRVHDPATAEQHEVKDKGFLRRTSGTRSSRSPRSPDWIA
jgi:hypothetical protein